MSIMWRGPLLVLSLVAVLAVAGCGGDDNDTSTAASTQAAAAATTGSEDSDGGSDDAFCSKLEAIGKDLQDQSATSDPQQLGKVAEQIEDALKSADPPSELQDEWTKLEDLFSTMAQVMSKADLSDPSSLLDLKDDLEKFQAQASDLGAATTALSQYAAEHCGGAFG